MNNFNKYHGAGNDFIMINNTGDDCFDIDSELFESMCHRRFGIGADGVIVIENSDHFDFKMRYFNSDGVEGTMCGNGGRCAANFAFNENICNNQTEFEAIDGRHSAEIIDYKTVALKMQDAIPPKKTSHGWFIDTGSPHVVVFTDDIDNLDVYNEGAKIRYSTEYAPEGVNVNFIKIEQDKIKIRTYERGVEDETWACGTGSVASAIVANWNNDMKHVDAIIEAKGGVLEVSFDKSEIITEIFLKGSAIKVFEGRYYGN